MSTEAQSLLTFLASLELDEATRRVDKLNEEQLKELRYGWREVRARAAQLAPPGNWRTWLLLAGRGFGKTRTGAEWVLEQVWEHGRRRIALIAPTAADARDGTNRMGAQGNFALSRPSGRSHRRGSEQRRRYGRGYDAEFMALMPATLVVAPEEIAVGDVSVSKNRGTDRHPGRLAEVEHIGPRRSCAAPRRSSLAPLAEPVRIHSPPAESLRTFGSS
jgi:hypothetical protein